MPNQPLRRLAVKTRKINFVPHSYSDFVAKEKNYVNKINSSKIICQKIYKKTQAWASNPVDSQKMF
jgi:hypothetical protein